MANEYWCIQSRDQGRKCSGCTSGCIPVTHVITLEFTDAKLDFEVGQKILDAIKAIDSVKSESVRFIEVE